MNKQARMRICEDLCSEKKKKGKEATLKEKKKKKKGLPSFIIIITPRCNQVLINYRRQCK
jgi:hypothetical protein